MPSKGVGRRLVVPAGVNLFSLGTKPRKAHNKIELPPLPQIVANLKLYSAVHGGDSISAKNYDHWPQRIADSWKLADEYGWAELCKAAGTRAAHERVEASREELIANLEHFVSTNRTRQISTKAYTDWDEAIASVSTIAKLCGGSWWDACRAANAFSSKIPASRLTAQLLVEVMLEATFDPHCNPRRRAPGPAMLKELAKKSGCPVSYKTYERVFRRRKTHEKKSGLRTCWELVLEAWPRAVAAPDAGKRLALEYGGKKFTVNVPTGVDPESFEESRNKAWTRDEMIKSLRECANELGKRSLTQREFDGWHEAYVSQQVSKRFDGWDKAMAAAGLTVTTIFLRDVTRADLIQHLLDAAQALNERPTSRAHLAAYGDISGRRYTHYHYAKFFGSIAGCWKQILQWQQGETSEEVLLAGAAPRTGTKGIVYLFRSADGKYTIGKTTNLKQRLRTYRTHNPHITVLAHKVFSDMAKKERELHTRFAHRRIGREEWFQLSEAEVAATVAMLA